MVNPMPTSIESKHRIQESQPKLQRPTKVEPADRATRAAFYVMMGALALALVYFLTLSLLA